MSNNKRMSQSRMNQSSISALEWDKQLMSARDEQATQKLRRAVARRNEVSSRISQMASVARFEARWN